MCTEVPLAQPAQRKTLKTGKMCQNSLGLLEREAGKGGAAVFGNGIIWEWVTEPGASLSATSRSAWLHV